MRWCRRVRRRCASLPVLAGTAAIPIVAALGRRVAGDAGGIWAAVIGAVAPALVVSSLDARMYMLATMLVLASTLCLLRALDQPSAAALGAVRRLSILAVYTVYFALFAVLAQVLTVAVLYRRRPDPWCSWSGARHRRPSCSLAPWVVVASSQLSHGAGGFWVPKLSVVSLFGGLEQFFTGPPINTWVAGYARDPHPGACRVTPPGCRALAALCSTGAGSHRDGAGRRRSSALLGGIGVAVMILVSLFHPLEDGRYLSTAWAPLYPARSAQGWQCFPWRRGSLGARWP